jgi:hypothetical protein
MGSRNEVVRGEHIHYLSARLRVAAVVEYLRSQQHGRLNTTRRHARICKHQALSELFPMRRSIGGLRPKDKQTVYGRAMELAQAEGNPAVIEFIGAQRDDAWSPVQSCARFYKEYALSKSYPDLKTMCRLSPEQEWDVYSAAIETAIQDAFTGTPRP